MRLERLFSIFLPSPSSFTKSIPEGRGIGKDDAKDDYGNQKFQ